MHAGDDANKCQKVAWNFNHSTRSLVVVDFTLRVERAKYFKTDQTFQPRRIHYKFESSMAAARAQKSIHPAKYFHFARLVCFGVKLKYIIDSASAAKQLEIHIDMKKRRKIECKNLYFHSITRRKNQHHTRHLLKLRNHESWLHSSNTLLPSFKLHLHLTPRWRAFFPFSRSETESESRKMNIWLCKVRVPSRVSFLFLQRSEINTVGGGVEKTKNCWYIKLLWYTYEP